MCITMDQLKILKNISSVDGRYKHKCAEISSFFSEYSLIQHRILVELKWLLFLNEKEFFFKKISKDAVNMLENFQQTVDEDIIEVKRIEAETNHDVKAVEYFLKKKLANTQNKELLRIKEFVHFLCTSEDINNLAYALCISKCLQQVIIPNIQNILQTLKDMSISYSNIPLLSRTHGQPASSTTFGKEIANYYSRIYKHLENLKKIKIYGKCNGAVGNFNVHKIAGPDINWIQTIKEFVENSFQLSFSLYCTQIQDHDYICELSDCLSRINYTCIDLSVDMWLYISNNLLKLKMVKTEIGSSTMPHKINPIDFENAEGNLHVANALFKLFSMKLPTSRLQRDLSDSTILRNLGSAFAHALIAYKSLGTGLSKIDINKPCIDQELHNNWSILAEPIQIILKKYNVENAYEEMKEFTRGKQVDKEMLQQFIKQKNNVLPKEAILELLNITPHNYTGYAKELANMIQQIEKEK